VDIPSLVSVLSHRKCATFASFTYTTKESAETARFTVILHSNVNTLYQKDIDALEAMLKTDLGVILHSAACELLASRQKSLEVGIGNNPAYTCRDVYTHFAQFPGVKLHNETGELHITGLVYAKTVITPGTYKHVNSSEKTLAKNTIRRNLPSGRFRQFAINPANLLSVRINGETLELD
jgi:hypothetical protein